MSLILDGAMGTELNRRGVNTELPLWTADSNIFLSRSCTINP